MYLLDNGRKFKSEIILQAGGNENSVPLKFLAFPGSFLLVLSLRYPTCIAGDDWLRQQPLPPEPAYSE